MLQRLALIIVISIIILAPISEAQEAQVIKIGVMACLTGECAETGKNTVDGATLHVERINQRGGIKGRLLQLVVQDSRDSVSGIGAVTAYQALRRDPKIELFIGPTWTPGGMAIAPIAAKDSVVITSPSLGVADFDQFSRNLFNTWPHDEISSRRLAQEAINQGIRRAAIFSTQQPWEAQQAIVFEEEFTKLGGTITVKVEPLPTSNDLRSEANVVVRSAPEAVFFSTVTRLDVAAREIYTLGYRGLKLVVMLDETRRISAAQALSGALYTSFPAASADFKDEFQARFGYVPGLSADNSYDTLGIYAEALLKTSGSPSDIITFMEGVRYSGVSGEIVFDKTGGVLKTPVILVVP